MQVKHLKVSEFSEAFSLWKFFNRVKAQVDFLERSKMAEVQLHIVKRYSIVLQVSYDQVHAMREDL